MRYFIQFSYKGTNYHGSQRQDNAVSIQYILEKCLSVLLRQEISVVLAGRTDAGVHAEQMWAHFDYLSGDNVLTDENLSFIYRLNAILPPDIVVKHIYLVSKDAHARYSALKRTYEYRIIHSKNPFFADYATLVNKKLNLSLLNDVSQLIIGEHDFASFSKSHTDVKTTFCFVYRAFWEKRQLIDKSEISVFIIEANRFLRNMIRALIGTMLDFEQQKIYSRDFMKIMDAKDRRFAGPSVPAKGLFLTNVEYSNDIFI